jgi:hypothetical protein
MEKLIHPNLAEYESVSYLIFSFPGNEVWIKGDV